MRVSFPAMQGRIGQRLYYATIMSMSEVPRLFKFNDWEQFSPEMRAQRVINKTRVPDIARYILENEDGYLFSSIAASFDSSTLKFVPVAPDQDVGTIEMELDRAEFIINDGQHRCAAIATALKENPALGKDKISVLLFPNENLERLQQMFSDLNRFAHKTSKSLDILYDHRDNLSSLTMDVAEEVDVFRGMLDKEKITIPLRSPKLFTLSTLYDANEELVGSHVEKCGSADYKRKLREAVEFWNELAGVMTDWRKVVKGDLKAPELRQEKINTHAVVMRALGGAGRALIEQYPDMWKAKLSALGAIDWRKSVGNRVNPLWDNVCITAGSVVSNRQARVETLAVLKRTLGLETSEDSARRKRRRTKGSPQLTIASA